MKVLVPIDDRADPTGFNFCKSGEVLYLGVVCGRDFRDDVAHCGCKRSFSGSESSKACSLALVEDRDVDLVGRQLEEADGLLQWVEEGVAEYPVWATETVSALAEALEEMGAGAGDSIRVSRELEGGFSLAFGSV